MTEAKFRFISDAAGGDRFTVVSFTGSEAISTLYQYELEIKAPLTAAINLDDLLDNPCRFVTEQGDQEYPVYGQLSSIDETRTLQGYVYYRALLVPRLWSLSTYKTNEIYTIEKTVDVIIQTVLENADFSSGTDFDLAGLDTSGFLIRDFRCQFGESDFDFISRLMENEGIFYYFDHSGDVEKIIFINDMNYMEIPRPGLIFDVAAQSSRLHDSINAWSCRKQRLSSAVTVRDFNPDQPSLDISGNMAIDKMGRGTDYLYGENIEDEIEASNLSTIRAEERLCHKTRYYAEGSVTRLQSGYLFGLDLHPNEKYNGVEYLVIEVIHEGQHLDMTVSGGAGKSTQSRPQYRNSFVAIEAAEQFRPARLTPKPRFYGTMTAFVYAEAAGGVSAEVDEQGRYRVHLPFDRAEGTKDSSDPDRKASTWIRMAQPYAGENEGMCFPLKAGTEVLLTFINGDPDRPIISSALANASQPSLLNDQNAHVASISTPGGLSVKSKAGSYNFKSSPVLRAGDQASASWSLPFSEGNSRSNYDYFLEQDAASDAADEAVDLARVNQYGPEESLSYDGDNLFHGLPAPSSATNYPFAKLNDFGQAVGLTATSLPADLQITALEEENDGAHIDRSTGPTYVHKSGSSFPYPEHERVYFFGTFHEDFHMDDLGISGFKRIRNATTGLIDYTQAPVKKEATDPGGADPEVFHFPAPGKDGNQGVAANFPKNRPRGVSEDKRWGDQLTYAFGRKFNWSGGAQLSHPKGGDKNGGAFGEFNYGNGYTENLQIATGGTSANLADIQKAHHNDYTAYTQFSDHYGSTSVSKTFGPTYSYQNGFSLDIKVGDSHSKTWGNSDSKTYGNSESYTDGDSTDTVIGDSTSWFHGHKMEFALSTDTEFKLADDNTFHLGLDTGIQIAGFIKFTAGVGMDLTVGPIFEGREFDAKAAITELESTVTKMGNTQVVLKNRTTTIIKDLTALETRALRLENPGLLVQG